MKVSRVILIVLDSVGIGSLPDADRFGDEGSNTLGHIASSVKGFALPNLVSLGLGNINEDLNLPASENPIGCFGQAAERSSGKDTITGHWEIAGVIPEGEFPYFPEGFPKEFIQAFEEKIGRKTIGNYPASGTEIIEQLGEQHIASGKPIVYTSSDSVFQIAMHEEIITLEEQYAICKIARDLLVGSWQVGRVIARPFVGQPGTFKRTSNRKDYAILPPRPTMLDKIKAVGMEVCSVGKISDIYAAQGVTQSVKTIHNMDGVDKTIEFIKKESTGLIMTNLVDFDMLFGHRRDVNGYGNALMEFDNRLPEIIDAMQDEDLLILTADHGCDPTWKGTDHTREYIPVLCYGKNIQKGVSIGTRNSFADIGATVCELLNTDKPDYGESFTNLLI